MKKGHWKVLVMILFVLAVFTNTGFSEQVNSIAVIDPARALETSTEGQKTVAQLQAKQQSIRDELNQIDNDVQGIENRLKTQRLTLTQEAQQKLAMDLDQLQTRRKRVEEDSIKDYQRLEFQLINRFKQDVLPIIETVAKEKGFSLVLDLSITGVAYFDQSIDITEEVVKRYNASKSAGREGTGTLAFDLSKNLF
jgi:outer membrane protein